MPAPWPNEFAEWKNAVEKMLLQHGTDITRLQKRVHQTPQEYTGAPHGWNGNPMGNPPVTELPPVVTTTPAPSTTAAPTTTADPGSGPNGCNECNLPDTLYVRAISDDSLVETLTFSVDCTWAGFASTFRYGFNTGSAIVWRLDTAGQAGGGEGLQETLDACTGILMTDGGLYYIADS